MNQTFDNPTPLPAAPKDHLSAAGSVTCPQTTPHQLCRGNSVAPILPQTYSTPPHFRPPPPHFRPPQPYLSPPPVRPLQPYPSPPPVRPLQPHPTTPLRPLQTHHNILQGFSMLPPQPYPGSPLRSHPSFRGAPLRTPQTQGPISLPAPLHQTPIGDYRQGAVQYTAVYPAHIAYSNQHVRAGLNYPVGRNVPSVPLQFTSVSVQPHPISASHLEDLFRSSQNTTENSLLQSRSAFRGPPASEEEFPKLKPSQSWAKFHFNRKRVLAASKCLYS